jgi:hypothetical protein
MEIRNDDTVEVKFNAKVLGRMGDLVALDLGYLGTNHTQIYVPRELITDVILRAETDAEKIVRIEQEKADIKNAYDTLDKMHQEVLARVKELERQVKWQIEKAEIENKVNMEAMFGAIQKGR